VNADDGVGVQRVGHRGALVDARPEGVVVAPRHRGPHAELIESLPNLKYHIPIEGVLGESAAGGGTTGLAVLGAAAPRGHLTIDRGVIGAVVAGIEEDDHPCDAWCGSGVRCGNDSGERAQTEDGGRSRGVPQQVSSGDGIRRAVPARVLHSDTVACGTLHAAG
jgi:hypothetical protein